MSRRELPNAICAVIGQILGAHYYNHARLEHLFWEAGAPGEPPLGNCVVKCTSWLKRCNADPRVDPSKILGKVLEEFMEVDIPPYHLGDPKQWQSERQRVHAILAQYGLSYRSPGQVLDSSLGVVSRSLKEILKARDLPAVEKELERALEVVNSNPPTALTAACALIESVCRLYIDDEGLERPGKQTIKELWRVVADHIGFDPAAVEDDDLRRILSGLFSIVDGIGSLRTHAGSAHGKGRRTYKVEPRHAKLAVHTAHSLAVFLIETWDKRKTGS